MDYYSHSADLSSQRHSPAPVSQQHYNRAVDCGSCSFRAAESRLQGYLPTVRSSALSREYRYWSYVGGTFLPQRCRHVSPFPPLPHSILCCPTRRHLRCGQRVRIRRESWVSFC
ncbi:hypothetical protein AA313_de0200312 [Arthrobotrys entomopaga]|nr:hypothetical protein AA313_de0200312 [Arthrobotrys entomopaga]